MMTSLHDKEITVRKFKAEDVEKKVEWINNPNNNKYLHYDLPLEQEKTLKWFEKIQNCEKRIDAVIEYKSIPIGLIGLLDIDKKNKKAEYYICIGESGYKGKGIAKIASKLLIAYGFQKLDLNKIYLFTEEENTDAQILFEKLGFEKEGFLKEDLIYNDNKVNRYVYGITKEVFELDRNSFVEL